MLACAVSGQQWSGKVVTCHCDNQSVVALVNSGYSPVPQIMHFLRCLFFIRAYYQLEVWAIHVPGIENTLADAISRDDLHYFLSQVPRARGNHTNIPQALLSLLVDQQPDWTSQAWAGWFRSCFPPA